MLRRVAGTLAVTALVVTAASAQTFANKAQQVRAGVVILGSVTDAPGALAQSAAPHVWYNFDSNRGIKPVGWNVYNPHAPTQVTPDLLARWTAIGTRKPSAGAAPAIEVGTRLSKRTAAYWEVFLDDASDVALADYDILVLNPATNAFLNSERRERLRRFVDRGGVLWIDPAGVSAAGTDIALGFPVAFTPASTGAGADFAYVSEPLMSRPMTISPRDLYALNAIPGSPYNITDALPGNSGVEQITALLGDVTGDAGRTQYVAYSGAGRTVGVTRIGDGFVVTTSRGVSLKLNRDRGSVLTAANNANLYFFGENPVLDQDGQSASKFVVNLVSMTGEFRQPQGGSRKMNSTSVDLTAPLMARGSLPHNATENRTTAPKSVLYKGYLVQTHGNRVVVFDSDPGRDLDNDGFADDGLRDPAATGYDLIWEATLTGPLSAPVCSELPKALNSGRRDIPDDVVALVDESGRLIVFELAPRAPNGTLLGNNAASPIFVVNSPGGTSYSAEENDGGPIAPTIHEGIVYVTDVASAPTRRGRMWQASLLTGQRIVSEGGQQWVSSTVLPEFTAPASIGYVPILDNAGGMDKVAYVPYRRTENVQDAPSAGVVSLWLGAKGEKPAEARIDGTDLVVITRSAQVRQLPAFLGDPGGPLGIRLNVLTDAGVPLTASQLNDLFTGQIVRNGLELRFPLRNGWPAALGVEPLVRIDYTADWGAVANLNVPGDIGIQRGKITLPDIIDNSDFKRRVNGSVAVDPKGNFFITTRQGRGSGLFGFREQAPGRFRCIMRYELYGPHQFPVAGAGNFNVPSLFRDDDAVSDFIPVGTPEQKQIITGLTFAGPPSVSNGRLYATARGFKNLGGFPVETSVLMAFRAEPETPQIRVADLAEGSTILQYDLSRSPNTSSPNVPTVLSSNTYRYDRDTGTVRFDNLATAPAGTVQNCLSLSQPVIIRRQGRPDEVLYPNAQPGSRWSPLLYYMVLNAYQVETGPVVTGDTVFIGGSSRVRRILNDGFAGGLPPLEGLMFAIDGDIPLNDSFISEPTDRPWMRQVRQLRRTGVEISGNPKVKWPQIAGITSFDDYKIRLNQTLLRANFADDPDATISSSVFELVAGDGALVATGNRGQHVFTRSDFLIADEGRIGQYDPSGIPSWIATTFGGTGDGRTDERPLVESRFGEQGGTADAGSSATVNNFVRPTRVYRVGNDEKLVVDAGSNRIVRMDSTNVATRTITGFKLDPNRIPEGFQPNGSLSLKNPRDVVTFSTYEFRPNLDSVVTPGDGSAAGATEYWVHYLIADAGNRRLVEIIDRYAYDPATRRVLEPIRVNGVPQVGVLLWHSPSALSGRRFEYTSVSRVFLPTFRGDGTTGRHVYFAGVGGALPTQVNNEIQLREAATSTGSIVVFDPLQANGYRVIDELLLPAVPEGVIWSRVPDTASPNDFKEGFFSPQINQGSIRRVRNVHSITTRSSAQNGSVRVMVADDGGAYEFVYTDPGQINSVSIENPLVSWMMPNSALKVLKRNGASPSANNAGEALIMFARRLDSGDVLLVNGYFGRTFGTLVPNIGVAEPSRRVNTQPFSGSVIQISDTYNPSLLNLGFGTGSIVYELQSTQGVRELVLPVFADRR